jgi:predicted ATPase
MPKTLRFAKFILDQGEVDRAMEIICTYIGQSNYLEEVESWITEAIDSGIHQSARLWEAAGDIAVAREKYTEALNAYTKAMQVLMHREEEQDEMD